MILNLKKLDLYSKASLTISFLTILYIVAVSKGGVYFNDNPIGHDFYAFWSTGKVALTQGYSAPYDPTLLQKFQSSSLPINQEYINYWFYPPLLLYWLALFWAQFPYLVAYAIYCVLMLGLYHFTIKKYYSEFSVLILFGIPAVQYSILGGQNGGLSAFLMILAVLNMDKKPILSGILFGLLAFKPQLCVLIPFALLASRQWKIIISGIITLIVSVCISIALFGFEIWLVFFKTLTIASDVIQIKGSVGFEKLTSLYAAMRFWGMPILISYITHIILALFVIIKTFQTWQKGNFEQKAMTLILGTLLIPTHVLDYDYVMTALVLILFVKSKNFELSRYELILMIILWIAPYISRGVMEHTGVPLLVLSNFALFLLISPFKPLAFRKKMF